MSSGQVAEFAQPAELLEKTESLFYILVEQTGQLQQLKSMAVAARKRKQLETEIWPHEI